MLFEHSEEGASVGDVDVFWRVAIADTSGVDVKIGLAPFECKVGFHIVGKRRGKNGECQSRQVPMKSKRTALMWPVDIV
jgi:hypothetical protein